MYMLDASLFARDFDVRDPEHAICRALLQRPAADTIRAVVPTLLLHREPIFKSHRSTI